MKTADEHIWAVGEIASYNGGMCYQLSAPGTLVGKKICSCNPIRMGIF